MNDNRGHPGHFTRRHEINLTIAPVVEEVQSNRKNDTRIARPVYLIRPLPRKRGQRVVDVPTLQHGQKSHVCHDYSMIYRNGNEYTMTMAEKGVVTQSRQSTDCAALCKRNARAQCRRTQESTSTRGLFGRVGFHDQ